MSWFWKSKPTDPLESPPPKPKVDPILDNPWYPLSGPPTSIEEEEILQKAILKEQEILRSTMGTRFKDSQDAKHSLEQASRNNCVDLELKWRLCLTQFTFERFFTLCDAANGEFKQCMFIQKRNMQRLGYERAYIQDQSLLEKIQDKADQMYLQEIRLKRNKS